MIKNHSFFFLFFFVFSSSNILAQASFGIKVQINNMGAPLVIKRDLFSKPQGSVLNPGFGLFFEFKLSEQLSFQPELNYQEHRKSYILTGSEKTYNISIMEYVRLPLLLKYSIPFKKWNLIGLIGPNPGYALLLKSGETNQNWEITKYNKLDFSEHQIRRIDIGLISGIGIEKIIANKFKTKLTLRYNIGLLDIMEDKQSTFRNSGYILDMGFMIPLKREKKATQTKKNI
jgi:outer membrane protein with beta-barrel domain